MISIATEQGSLLKVLPDFSGEKDFGFHNLFGFVSESAAEERARTRKRAGLRALPSGTDRAWRFNFRLKQNGGKIEIQNSKNCSAESLKDGSWKLKTENGNYVLSAGPLAATPMVAEVDFEDKTWTRIFIAALLIVFLLPWIPDFKSEEKEPEVIEMVTVKIQAPEIQKTVKVPELSLQAIPQQLQKANAQAKRAIQQNLGFLGLLGKKDLTKALGGMPIALKETSAGAGPGGTQGSGGETLVGLGAGVKRTTVGNTGVAGLGGIGTKGAGGGAGGYGNMMVGSGEGKGLTSLALSQDVVLEGGLDRSVIQATIAKYLSQVRACYEEGLRKNTGLVGQVSMAFEINGDGGLNYSRVQRSTLGNADVESCISTKMMNWKFPKPTGGVNVKVAYPFMLRPAS